VEREKIGSRDANAASEKQVYGFVYAGPFQALFFFFFEFRFVCEKIPYAPL
jgi:hypothetical protein